MYKFRFWDKTLNKMSECYTLDKLIKEGVTTLSLEPMVYSGLRDKNGQDIYEYDILRFYSKSFECCLTMYVSIDLITGMSFKSGVYSNIPINDTLYDSWEVIGDVYRNPELLDSKFKMKK